MDPEALAPAFAGVAAVLALLGAQRRSRRGNPSSKPTAGEQVESITRSATDGGAYVVRRVGDVTSAVLAGGADLVGRTLTTTTSAATRSVLRLPTALTAAGVGAAGRVVARGAGLVVDGGAVVTERVVAAPRRRRPPAALPTQAQPTATTAAPKTEDAAVAAEPRGNNRAGNRNRKAGVAASQNQHGDATPSPGEATQ